MRSCRSCVGTAQDGSGSGQTSSGKGSWHISLPVHCFGLLQNGDSALHVAAEKGFADVCTALIDNGARIDKSGNVSTCLSW